MSDLLHSCHLYCSSVSDLDGLLARLRTNLNLTPDADLDASVTSIDTAAPSTVGTYTFGGTPAGGTASGAAVHVPVAVAGAGDGVSSTAWNAAATAATATASSLAGAIGAAVAQGPDGTHVRVAAGHVTGGTGVPARTTGRGTDGGGISAGGALSYTITDTMSDPADVDDVDDGLSSLLGTDLDLDLGTEGLSDVMRGDDLGSLASPVPSSNLSDLGASMSCEYGRWI